MKDEEAGRPYHELEHIRTSNQARVLNVLTIQRGMYVFGRVLWRFPLGVLAWLEWTSSPLLLGDDAALIFFYS